MAAYAAVVSLLNVLDNIQNHRRLSNSLDKNQIECLSEKIDFLLDFIENDCHGVISNEAQELERQITSAAHAAEDVIESHVVDQIHSDSVSLLELQPILQDVDQVKEMVVNFKDRETAAKDVQAKYPVSAIWSTPDLTNSRKSKMFGFDKELIRVMDILTGQQSSLQIIPFVGMGGSGKTTLARNVYEKQLISQHLDIRGWVTISQNYNLREIFLKLLSCQSFSTPTSESETDDELAHKLYQCLIGRRYLIILDDMWSIEVWDKIKFFFPDSNNRSRIVVTTRLSNLALHFGSNNQLLMKFLDEDKSWNLFCENAFAQEGCPPELEEIGKKIVGKCKGLPLMIVVIGGLLRKSSMTQEHWENISKDINLILDKLGAEDEKSLDVLSLSYIHLPAHLKPCFLYMGIFPEDREIYVFELVKLWVAEGFLKPNKTQSSEEVSKCYLKDLVDRNLILVHDLSVNGEVETCGMHDLLKDLCLKTCEKEKFMCVVRVSDDDIRGCLDKERRIIVFHDANPKVYRVHFRALESASLTRSLVGYDLELSSKFKLLRVSNKIHSSLEDSFTQVNLRYFRMQGSLIDDDLIKFPSSISLLWNLQTLLCFGFKAVAPPEIWEMRQLRHVMFAKIYLPDPPLSDQQDDSVVLWNLQTLLMVTNLTLSDEVCKRIPNINKLGIMYDESMSEKSPYHNFCLWNIGRFRKLDSLFCNSYGSGIVGTDQEVHLLQNLAFLTSLRTLRLHHFRLGSEDLEIIGSLPALVSLDLLEITFSGNEWRGKFRGLKLLQISNCDGLTQWSSTEDDSDLPVLEHLNLYGLSQLDELPLAIGENTLRYIRMSHCSLSAAISAAKILEERMSLGNDDDLVVEITFNDRAEKDVFLEQITKFECLGSNKLIIYCYNNHQDAAEESDSD